MKGFLTTSISARRLRKTIRQIRRVSPHLESISKTSSRVGEANPGPSVTINTAQCRSEKEKLARLATEDPIVRTDASTRLDAMDIWPEGAFQVSQELDYLFEAFNQPQVFSGSYAGCISGDESESGQSNLGQNLATFNSLDNSRDVFGLLTEHF